MARDILYLDQAAAARPAPEVLDYYRVALERCFANQEAAHSMGYALRRELDLAASELSAALTGSPDRAVVWGNSGTELLALLADSPAAAGRCVLSTPLEHPASGANFRRAAARVALFKVDRTGRIAAPPEGAAPGLVMIHHVQSELGVVQEPERWRALFPGVPLAVDAIQSAGKLPLPEADYLVVSGHKFGSPGGAALLVSPRCPDRERFLAWARDRRSRDYRIGRPEPALMLTLSFAAKRAARERTRRFEAARRCSQLLRDRLTGAALPGGGRLYFTIPEAFSSPWICHLMLPGLQAGVVVRMLAERGVMCASGSACASESGEPSAALRAIGLPRRDGYSGLRISFGPEPEEEAAEKFVQLLPEVLKNY